MPLDFNKDLSELPCDPRERHEAFVDFFGRFLFWLRDSSLEASRKLIESDELRAKTGTIRGRYYEGVAHMPAEQREAAMLLVEQTLNDFLKRLAWFLGDEGTDSGFGRQHAYRFRVEMEIVDVETCETAEQHTINRGGKFFGSYWGRWLNQYSCEKKLPEREAGAE